MNNSEYNKEGKKSSGNLGDRGIRSQGAEDAGRLVNSLRADMIQGSEAVPEEENIAKAMNIKLIVGIIISIVAFLIIVCLITGSRRQMLARGLAGLFSWDVAEVQKATLTPVLQESSLVNAALTPIASATIQPTKTQAVIIPPTTTRTPTQQVPTNQPTTTPTETSAWQCRDALTITLEDVGQTMCTYGTVIETVEKPNNFMVIFSHERGAFYWVTYDLVWAKGEVDTCYYTTGKIDQIANTPILVFGYNNLPEMCPK